MKRFHGFFFFLIGFPILTVAVNMPNNPKLPTLNQEKEKPKNIVHLQSVVSFFGKDSSFKGQMSIPSFKLTIMSEKNGFQFYKEINLNDIKTIKIKKWKGVAFKNSKDGRHNFYPIEYEIVDHKGTSFIYQKNIPEINDFVFETELGTTKLFSYYVDYLNGSYWEMTKRRSADLETNKALKKVVNEIEIETFNLESQKIEKKSETKQKKSKKILE